MNNIDQKNHALTSLRRYGYQSQSYNILLGDKSYFRSSSGIDGVIAYVTNSGVALAAGDPVCCPSDLAAFVTEFRQFCLGQGWRCCFQAVTERCEEVLDELGFGSVKIGEEPIFDLTKLTWSGGKFRDLRKDVRTAERRGLSVVEYRPSLERKPEWETQMEELSRQWVEFKGSSEFSFLVGRPNLGDPGDRKYFLAMKDSVVEAFIVCTPIYARNGIYFDLMRRKKRTISGTAQLLIARSLELLRDQGYEMATLGTAPLANENVDDPDQNRFIELTMELAFNYLGYFHRFKPLYQFKEQFGAASWESRYLAYWPSRFHPVILYALLKAYDPTGVRTRLRKQLVAVWRLMKAAGDVPGDVIERILAR